MGFRNTAAPYLIKLLKMASAIITIFSFGTLFLILLNNPILFFRSNGLVNNADKAAVLYNGKGKSEIITVENVSGENLVSTYSEKLLGLHIPYFRE